MKLKTLLKGIQAVVKGSKEVEINGISADSRTISPGNLFIARKGMDLNGADFIPKAIEAGAVAIVADLYDPFLKVTQVIVPHPELLEAKLAARIFGEPSSDLFMVGITGSKGKTTTSYMTHHLLSSLKGIAGLVSGVETVIGDERRASTLTTHSAIHNQKLLKEMKLKGCKAVAFEVSSHGLHQGRVGEIDFDVGIYTNLYPDHLDYHKTVEHYAEAKKMLFANVSERALLNADCPWAVQVQSKCPVWTFGIDQKADIVASGIEFTAEGTQFMVEFEGKCEPFHLALMGRFNVYNALGAIGVGLHLGANLGQIAEILKTFRSAPGRLERVPNKKNAWVFVDYSHTGPALDNVLRTLREVARKRIICVFGCGGNRDPLRRLQTAQAAEKWADIAIVTTDNPRKEDPQAICEEILKGFVGVVRPAVILDRKEAIFHAIALSEAEDIVLIAGKGHEKYQIFADQTISFDDVFIAREASISVKNVL